VAFPDAAQEEALLTVDLNQWIQKSNAKLQAWVEEQHIAPAMRTNGIQEKQAEQAAWAEKLAGAVLAVN
jgi:hypothetical protein